MIRAARAQVAQVRRPERVRELERLVRRFEMADNAAVRRDGTTKARQDRRGDRLTINGGHDGDATEARDAAPAGVVVDELAQLIDRPDAVHVAAVLRAAPGEQTVASENEAVGV